jgi:hypothetical protein
VSNVWQTRRRVLLQQLKELAGKLRHEEPIPPTVLKEQTTRLLAGTLMLLQRHDVNERGQCRICSRPRTWQFWRRKPQCTVYQSLDFAMRQPLEFVWWPLLEDQ